MTSHTAGDLKRLALAGIRAEIEAFGSGAPDSFLRSSGQVVACVGPAVSDRSLFNSVYYEDAAALEDQLDELEHTYESHGVRAWTVWVPDDDRETAALLAERGHALDASPRAMALELATLAVRPGPELEGVEIAPCPQPLAAELNDNAYGYEAGAFSKALARRTKPELRWLAALEGDVPVGCLATIAHGPDRVVTGVATHREHRGRGIASRLLHEALARARDEEGAETASLQATKLGAGIYERLGFRDLGYVEMWELRRPEA